MLTLLLIIAVVLVAAVVIYPVVQLRLTAERRRPGCPGASAHLRDGAPRSSGGTGGPGRDIAPPDDAPWTTRQSVMRTLRNAFAVVLVAGAMLVAAAAVMAPLMPYLVVLFFLASLFYIAVKGR